MRIVVLGGHGKIAQLLLPKLVERGHDVAGMIREAGQSPSIREHGAEPVLGDLEREFESALDGADIVIFAAGSGGKTGADKTITVDLYGAIQSIKAAQAKGVPRFVMVSALKAEHPKKGPEKIRHYLICKKIADEYLRNSSLDYLCVRPGGLTDEPGSGKVEAGLGLEDRGGRISRENVAAFIAEAVTRERFGRSVVELLDGQTPIERAVEQLN